VQGQPPAPPPPPDVSQPGGVQYAPQGAQVPPPVMPPPVEPPPTAPPQQPYAQPTIQMPAQQVPQQGQYQQPAYGQSPYAQQPMGQYQQPQQYPPMPPQQYQQPYAAMGATGKRGSTALGLITILMGLVVIGSTFLAWVSASAMGISATVTGLSYMTGSSSGLGGGNFSLVLTGEGVIFFTGFFSLLFGALILIGGLVMLFRRRIGGVLTFIFALLATGVAAVDVAMIMSKMPGGSASYGIWMFVGASFVALVLGIVGLASSGG
jgi:hypothetical protein